MLETWLYSLASVTVVSLFSFVGLLALLPKREVFSKLLLFLVSFSAGGLLGGALFHLLPEATEGAGVTLEVSMFLFSGILVSFVVEKFVYWRHCHVPTSEVHPHTLGFMNLFGDGVHNFIDGLIIGGGYLAGVTVGLTTTLAVIMHEVPQEMGDFGVLVYAGFTKRRAMFYNFLTALTSVLGAATSMILSPFVQDLVVFLVPFGAGAFVYVACADLIPELRRVSSAGLSDSVTQLAALLLGFLAMLLIKLLVE